MNIIDIIRDDINHSKVLTKTPQSNDDIYLVHCSKVIYKSIKEAMTNIMSKSVVIRADEFNPDDSLMLTIKLPFIGIIHFVPDLKYGFMVEME